jgi:hypothetical protein
VKKPRAERVSCIWFCAEPEFIGRVEEEILRWGLRRDVALRDVLQRYVIGPPGLRAVYGNAHDVGQSLRGKYEKRKAGS